MRPSSHAAVDDALGRRQSSRTGQGCGVRSSVAEEARRSSRRRARASSTAPGAARPRSGTRGRGRRARRSDVADDRAPLDALGARRRRETEAPVDDRPRGLGEQTPPAARARPSSSRFRRRRRRVMPCRPIMPDEGVAVPDRPGRLDALGPAALRERDEALRVLPLVGRRHRRVPLDIGVLARLEDRIDIGLSGHRQGQPLGPEHRRVAPGHPIRRAWQSLAPGLVHNAGIIHVSRPNRGQRGAVASIVPALCTQNGAGGSSTTALVRCLSTESTVPCRVLPER